jgi:hypothetical protein
MSRGKQTMNKPSELRYSPHSPWLAAPAPDRPYAGFRNKPQQTLPSCFHYASARAQSDHRGSRHIISNFPAFHRQHPKLRDDIQMAPSCVPQCFFSEEWAQRFNVLRFAINTNSRDPRRRGIVVNL